MKKTRLIYAGVFAALLAAVVFIALYVNDSFVRPYFGDVLVVGVICAVLRIFLPDKIRFLPIFTAAFAVGVEILQYFDFVSLLGLAENPVLSVENND